MKNSLTLYELNALVRDMLALEMPDEYWVEAELSEAREVRGHCYLELIQKDEHSNTPVAKASAKCWASTWQLVKPHFMRVTGQEIHAGMKVLLKVYAQFHESYGFSWIVTDIDPTYTMGDMARKRMEIIRQLKEEGVFELQKELQLPMFCQHIAVISSANAAGYGDFVNQLENNEYGLMQEGFGLKVAKIGENGVTIDDILVHDAHCVDDTLQLKLAMMSNEEGFPIALGVIRDVKAPTYDEAVNAQIEEVKAMKKYHTFAELLETNDIWEVK